MGWPWECGLGLRTVALALTVLGLGLGQLALALSGLALLTSLPCGDMPCGRPASYAYTNRSALEPPTLSKHAARTRDIRHCGRFLTSGDLRL